MIYKIPPWKHQASAIDRFSQERYGALFFQQGCGKTSTLINTMRHKYEAHGFVVPTLVLCPQIVVENWRREWLAHSELKPSQIVTLTGTGSQRVKKFLQETTCAPQKIVITNYESLLVRDLQPLLKKWAKALLLDESQKCKDIASKRTKLTYDISKNCVYRFIASGTPVVNSLFDIYSQFLIMDQGKTFGAKLYDFKKEYFYDANANRPKHCYFPDWRPKQGSEAKINAKIYGPAIRVTKAECLDLPPLVRQMVNFNLSADQLLFYRRMEKDAVAYMADEVVSADMAIKKALRLQQVTSGFVKGDDGEIKRFLTNPRIDALAEVISLLPKDAKFIIWAVFKQNYLDIQELLKKIKIGFTELHGDVVTSVRQDNVDRFNSFTSDIRAILAHPAAGGIGINLVAASYSIFYTRNFSLENDLQAEARNHRGGSEIHSTITRIDIVANNTIDEVGLLALRDKLDVSEAVLNHIKGIKYEQRTGPRKPEPTFHWR